MKRILTLAASCVLLAACFKSEHLLLDLGKATHPIPEGEWVAGERAPPHPAATGKERSV